MTTTKTPMVIQGGRLIDGNGGKPREFPDRGGILIPLSLIVKFAREG